MSNLPDFLSPDPIDSTLDEVIATFEPNNESEELSVKICKLIKNTRDKIVIQNCEVQDLKKSHNSFEISMGNLIIEQKNFIDKCAEERKGLINEIKTLRSANKTPGVESIGVSTPVGSSTPHIMLAIPQNTTDQIFPDQLPKKQHCTESTINSQLQTNTNASVNMTSASLKGFPQGIDKIHKVQPYPYQSGENFAIWGNDFIKTARYNSWPSDIIPCQMMTKLPERERLVLKGAMVSHGLTEDNQLANKSQHEADTLLKAIIHTASSEIDPTQRESQQILRSLKFSHDTTAKDFIHKVKTLVFRMFGDKMNKESYDVLCKEIVLRAVPIHVSAELQKFLAVSTEWTTLAETAENILRQTARNMEIQLVDSSPQYQLAPGLMNYQTDQKFIPKYKNQHAPGPMQYQTDQDVVSRYNNQGNIRPDRQPGNRGANQNFGPGNMQQSHQLGQQSNNVTGHNSNTSIYQNSPTIPQYHNHEARSRCPYCNRIGHSLEQCRTRLYHQNYGINKHPSHSLSIQYKSNSSNINQPHTTLVLIKRLTLIPIFYNDC